MFTIEEVIFVNFKTYPRGTGKEAVEMAKICIEVSKENEKVKIIPVVQVVDLYRVGQMLGDTAEIWVQHVDGVKWGQNTGWILPEGVKNEGATGSFLNHSEHKTEVSPSSAPQAPLGNLRAAIERCQEIGLRTLVFASNLPELKRMVNLGSEMVAYEPPELIGSRTDSVASRSDVISEASKICQERKVSLIVGAGIHSEADIKVSLACGAVGVAIARDIMEADDPRSELAKLHKGFIL
ncbi:MAG: Triosephosphate isomerase [Microgenomates group bacterium GW2011_GWA2_44_7]|nr:MAG: Triosephosphate isomerase [Microgenomates group bacterium GW2011_GWA2_44_7]KKT77829.1 MAG: Triosephosphate isomerase [Microgenomates group bacterium GW2011_GWB1_44_8]